MHPKPCPKKRGRGPRRGSKYASHYGGFFHDGGYTAKELELVYDQGGKPDEIAHMRRFAAALTALADALETEDE